MKTSGYLYRLWSEGERLLAGGRYVAARGLLERAEGMAWRAREARALARLYLPLLEARRQIRYQAAEGRIVVGGDRWGDASAGTLLVAGHDGRALRLAGAVEAAARRTGRCWEALLLVGRGERVRVASHREPTMVAGLPVTWTRDAGAGIAEPTDAGLILPLPPAGEYEGRSAGLGALARESLLVAWEGLALRWQGRHALAKGSGPWEEMAWLRGALRIDPACEPVAMRLIAVAEGVERGSGIGR